MKLRHIDKLIAIYFEITEHTKTDTLCFSTHKRHQQNMKKIHAPKRVTCMHGVQSRTKLPLHWRHYKPDKYIDSAESNLKL